MGLWPFLTISGEDKKLFSGHSWGELVLVGYGRSADFQLLIISSKFLLCNASNISVLVAVTSVTCDSIKQPGGGMGRRKIHQSLLQGVSLDNRQVEPLS